MTGMQLFKEIAFGWVAVWGAGTVVGVVLTTRNYLKSAKPEEASAPMAIRENYLMID